MTQPPRKRGEPAAPTKADLERFADKIGQQIQGSEERVGDKIARVEAQGNARQEVNVKAQAEAAARTDYLGSRLDEVIATNLRGYRTLEQAQQEAKLVAERQAEQLKALEERAAPEAAEIAMHVGKEVVGANRQDNRRIAGAVMVTGGIGGGALLMTVINFIANHTTFVVGVLRFLSLGIVKATGGSHE